MVFVSETIKKEPIGRQSVLHIFMHTLKYYFVTLQQRLSDLGTYEIERNDLMPSENYTTFCFLLF